MHVGDFHKIRGLQGIASYFDFPIEVLNYLTSIQDQSVVYIRMDIPKKNPKRPNSFRTVYKAFRPIAQLQKNIAKSITDSTTFPPHVHGFVKGRSTASNATPHIGRKLLLNADILDFFDSITIGQIEKVFEDLGCNSETAKLFAKLCTLNGAPRQGLHTSPVISNLVAAELDNDILEICTKHSATYTRYSDDIAISSDVSLPSQEDMGSILAKHGFSLHPDKFKISKRGKPQFVTGLSIFDQKYPRVPKKLKRRLRLELHYIGKYGFESFASRHGLSSSQKRQWARNLRGNIDYVNAIEPELANRYYSQFPESTSNKLELTPAFSYDELLELTRKYNRKPK